MRVGAVIHARMGSSRLPGKVLVELGGRPALIWLLERLDHARELDDTVVATSVDPADDPLAEWCDRQGIACHRGPLDDLATRVLEAARSRSLDAIARVNGDSPLLDQRLVDRGVAMARAGGADLVSNVRPRTFPPGQSVEIVRTGALETAVARMDDPEDREHVTSWLYRQPEITVERFEAADPVTEPRLTLDTPEDRERLAAILRAMERPHWEYSYAEVLELARATATC